MKRAAAIVLSLIFIWVQEIASAQLSFLPAKAVCACCDCRQPDCCVSSATPDAQSLPVTGVPAGTKNNLSLLASTLVAWTLPVTAPAQISLFASAPLPAPGVPLFTRHCALLI